MPESPIATVRVASIMDPSLDWAAMGGLDALREYASTRNRELLRFLPGRETETRWFTFAPLTEEGFHKYVELQGEESTKWTFAFLCCIRGVHGWQRMGGPFHREDWTPSSTTKVKSLRLEVWPEDVLRVVPPRWVQDLGKWCYERAALQQETVDFFDLPPGCAALMYQRISRAVTLARNTAESAATSERGRSEPTSDVTASESNGTMTSHASPP